MTNNPATVSPDAARTHKKRPWWSQALKILALIILIPIIVAIVWVGGFYIKYRRIVAAKRHDITGIRPLEFGKFVDPFIGTGGYPWVCANNFPGAMTPFGMVRLGPETVSFVKHRRALNSSGYFYGDDQLLGFSHTRLNGTGATDGGHFLVVPATKPIRPDWYRNKPALRFSHREEMASPGYYAVKLPELGALVELTATPRVGVHRYTFNPGKPAHIYIDIANALGGKRSKEGTVNFTLENQEVTGSVKTFGTFASRYGGLMVYFAAQLDQPFVAANKIVADGDKIGVDLDFGRPSRPIVLKLAISHVSVENARENLTAEAVGDFDEILKTVKRSWEEKLSLVQIQGGTEKQRRIFYTALFRIFEMPTLFTDANGDYIGFDHKVHKAKGFNYYTDFSLWDTFRTTHPLYTLLVPKAQRDMMISLVSMMKQGGWLPRWPSGEGYSNSMLGTPADIVIADSYLKGIREFDVEAAYQSMRRTALAPVPAGSAFSGREGVDAYLKYGYCPSGMVRESVARTFEYAWADHAISHLAAALEHTNDAKLFEGHSIAYRKLWNPQTQYFQPRDADGKFFEPFKPLLLTYWDSKGKYTKDYVEGSALQWRWSAPYDAAGMIGLFKSREYFVDELNHFFSKSSSAMGHWNPGPYYWHGNQPDIHAAYLFNEAARPDLTQKWVRWILDNKYSDTYDGLDGNDDAGTLSAWYIFSALGFYPVPGSDKYELGAPLFENAEVKLGTNVLLIAVKNFDPTNRYVEQVSVNGKALDRTWISHAEVQNGGKLEFKMSPMPVQTRFPSRSELQ